MLYRDPSIQAALALCANGGRFLFEARPDLFPPFLADVEIELWGMYYRDREERMKAHG